MTEQCIYTIGHGILPHNDFFSILSQHVINILVDVRRIPYSNYATQYNKEILEYTSYSYNISYFYMGDILGSQSFSSIREQYTSYTSQSQSEAFTEAIHRLICKIQKGYRIVLMCAEYEAYSCHRHTILAKAFEEKAIRVYHITKDSTLIPALSYSFGQYSLYD